MTHDSADGGGSEAARVRESQKPRVQKEVLDTGWLSVMRVRIVCISSIDKAGVGDKKSFHPTDRFCDLALRLAGQKLVL
jgi:hypothetical protein